MWRSVSSLDTERSSLKHKDICVYYKEDQIKIELKHILIIQRCKPVSHTGLEPFESHNRLLLTTFLTFLLFREELFVESVYNLLNTIGYELEGFMNRPVIA